MVNYVDLLGDTLQTWPILENVGRLDGGGEQDSTNIQMLVSTTEDDPTASPTWSAFQTLTLNNYRARAYRLRVTLETTDTQRSPVIESLTVNVDVPDRHITNPSKLRTDSGNPLGIGILAVDFSDTSHNSNGEEFYGPTTPSIGITLQNGQSGDYYVLSAITKSGFTITIRDSGGALADREFDYIAKGYGAKKV